MIKAQNKHFFQTLIKMTNVLMGTFFSHPIYNLQANETEEGGEPLPLLHRFIDGKIFPYS